MPPSDDTSGAPTPTDPARTAAVDEAARTRRESPDRVVAFTDGVFAIVITILVLEVAVPANLDEVSFRDVMDELRPTLAAWIISFLLTGMYWVMHRDLFAGIRYVTRDLVWLNLLFLLPACLIPFAASVLGEYPDEPVSFHVYGTVLVAVTLMRVALYVYVGHRPELLWEPSVPEHSRLGLVLVVVPIPVYLVAMALAGAVPVLSLVLFFVVPLAYFVLVTVLRDRPATRAEAEDFS